MRFTIGHLLCIWNVVIGGYFTWYYFFVVAARTLDLWIPLSQLWVLCAIFWALIFNLDDIWLNKGISFERVEPSKEPGRKWGQ